MYLVGYALPEGLSTLDKFKEFGNIENMPLAFDMAEDQTVVTRDPKLLFSLQGPGVDDAEIEAYVKTLCRWHGKCMFQPLEHAAWRELPVVYIHTTSDLSIPTPEQQSMVEGLEKRRPERANFYSGVWPLPQLQRGAGYCRRRE